MIIPCNKSVIPACDCDVTRLEEVVRATADLEKIGGYKIGFELALAAGLPRAVEIIRRHTDKPIIYDHQKAGTDIPDTGEAFARVCKISGVDAVILFPQAGPETERAWIDFARNEGLGVIVGGLMTHKKYVRSEGGYIADDAIIEMYEKAAGLGINDFVVPGNNPEAIRKIRAMLEREHSRPVFYSPGFAAQGGKIGETAQAAGGRYHAIVGRAICGAKDIRSAASELCEQICEDNCEN